MARFTIQSKFTFTYVIFFILLVTTFSMAYFYSRQLINSFALEKNIDGVLREGSALLQLAYEKELAGQQQALQFFSNRIIAAEIRPLKVYQWQAINQVLKDSTPITLPSLWLNGEEITGKSDFIDKITSNTNQFYTVFQLIDQGLIRIATNVTDQEKKRALGTFIPKDSPVYQAIIQNREYSGRAVVVGQNFLTVYRPLKNPAGTTIGAIFAGTPETTLDQVKKTLLTRVLGTTGYLYALDAQATLVMHPLIEGKSLANTTDADGRPIFQEMVKNKQGSAFYHWQNKGDEAPRLKFMRYLEVPGLQWILAAGSYMEELYIPLRKLEKIFALVLLVAIGILGPMGWLMYRTLKYSSQQLNGASMVVSDGARDIADGNAQLAKRTQSQSSALEQTAATLEEITSTVKQTADHALQAGQLATGAVELSRHGKEIQANTGKAMNEIASSGKKISEIVDLVADIAFQTNILAINAAIEAAKAGEQGKGFAVVAIEVRELAQRASESSKEINQLITAVLGKVQHGEVMVAESSSNLTAVASEIEKLADLVAEIAAAAKEQHQAIEQINQAVSHLDNNNQQNSALVEEIASSSQLMAQNSAAINATIVENFGATQRPQASDSSQQHYLPPSSSRHGEASSEHMSQSA